MPVTKNFTQTTYQFHELSDRAKDTAVSIFTQDMWEWHTFEDYATEDWTEWFIPEKLQPFGFDLDKKDLDYESDAWGNFTVRFKGSIDLEKWLKANKLANTYRALYDAARGASQHHAEAYFDPYHYSKYHITVSVWCDSATPAEAQAKEVEELLNEWVEARWSDFADVLKKEYDYLNSEEHVAELCEANGYEFDEDGNFPPRKFELAF